MMKKHQVRRRQMLFSFLLENLRALVIRPMDQWPTRSGAEKQSPLKDTDVPVHQDGSCIFSPTDQCCHYKVHIEMLGTTLGSYLALGTYSLDCNVEYACIIQRKGDIPSTHTSLLAS